MLACAQISARDIDGETRVVFARNVDGDELMCGVDEHRGAVLEHNEEYGVGDCLGASVASFLESYRDKLLSSQLEYVDECGVIECSTATAAETQSNKK
jgi:hypothetical protein